MFKRNTHFLSVAAGALIVSTQAFALGFSTDHGTGSNLTTLQSNTVNQALNEGSSLLKDRADAIERVAKSNSLDQVKNGVEKAHFDVARLTVPSVPIIQQNNQSVLLNGQGQAYVEAWGGKLLAPVSVPQYAIDFVNGSYVSASYAGQAVASTVNLKGVHQADKAEVDALGIVLSSADGVIEYAKFFPVQLCTTAGCRFHLTTADPIPDPVDPNPVDPLADILDTVTAASGGNFSRFENQVNSTEEEEELDNPEPLTVGDATRKGAVGNKQYFFGNAFEAGSDVVAADGLVRALTEGVAGE